MITLFNRENFLNVKCKTIFYSENLPDFLRFLWVISCHFLWVTWHWTSCFASWTIVSSIACVCVCVCKFQKEFDDRFSKLFNSRQIFFCQQKHKLVAHEFPGWISRGQCRVRPSSSSSVTSWLNIKMSRVSIFKKQCSIWFEQQGANRAEVTGSDHLFSNRCCPLAPSTLPNMETPSYRPVEHGLEACGGAVEHESVGDITITPPIFTYSQWCKPAGGTVERCAMSIWTHWFR